MKSAYQYMGVDLENGFVHHFRLASIEVCLDLALDLNKSVKKMN